MHGLGRQNILSLNILDLYGLNIPDQWWVEDVSGDVDVVRVDVVVEDEVAADLNQGHDSSVYREPEHQDVL